MATKKARYYRALNQELKKRGFRGQVLNGYEALKPSDHREYQADYRDVVDINGASFERLARISCNLDRNNSAAIGVNNSVRDTVVGSVGIQVEPMPLNRDGEVDPVLTKKISMMWTKFLRNAEVTGLNFAQLQRLASLHWAREGEVFFQVITQKSKDIGNQFPFILQMIPGDMIPNLTDKERGIYSGIKVNRWNRPVGYYFKKGTYSFSVSDCQYVDANSIIHLVNRRSIKEKRGIPMITSAIPSITDLAEYSEAEVIKAKQSASLVFAVYKDDPDHGGGFLPDFDDDDEDSPEEQAAKTAAQLEAERIKEIRRDDDRAEMHIKPGTSMMNLQPNERIDLIKSDLPASNLEKYRANILKDIATATGVNYSSLSRNYDGNYSSQRQGLIDSWKTAEGNQNEFASQLVEKTYQKFIETCQEHGFLPASDEGLIDNANYTFPVMPWIDPAKEANAKRVLNESGLKSKQELIRENGGNPDETFAQLKREEEMGFGIPKTIADVRTLELEDEAKNDEVVGN